MAFSKHIVMSLSWFLHYYKRSFSSICDTWYAQNVPVVLMDILGKAKSWEHQSTWGCRIRYLVGQMGRVMKGDKMLSKIATVSERFLRSEHSMRPLLSKSRSGGISSNLKGIQRVSVKSRNVKKISHGSARNDSLAWCWVSESYVAVSGFRMLLIRKLDLKIMLKKAKCSCQRSTSRFQQIVDVIVKVEIQTRSPCMPSRSCDTCVTLKLKHKLATSIFGSHEYKQYSAKLYFFQDKLKTFMKFDGVWSFGILWDLFKWF